MGLASRRVIWFAVTDRPDAAWVTQQARNVSWELTELGVRAKFLIHDHDAKYGGGDRLTFGAHIIETVTDSWRLRRSLDRARHSKDRS